MTLKAVFTPTVEVHHARCERLFRDAIGQSPANDYILNMFRTGPLEYLELEARPHEVDTPNLQYFYTQRPTGEITGALTVRRQIDRQAFQVLQISVDPEEQGKGYARALLHALFAYVDSKTPDYEIRAANSFEPAGKRYLPAAYAETHRRFPAVRVSYRKQPAITGERPYCLDAGGITPEIVYL